MADRLLCLLAQTVHIQSCAGGKLRRDPLHHRNVGLGLRGERIGGAVQIEVVFAQRLAVIGHVPQGATVAALLLQQADRAGEEVVGIQQGVVVGVDDALAIALLQFVGAADRFELFEGLRIAQVVGRTMAALLVQDQQQVARLALQPLRQSLEQDLVVALIALTQLRILGVAQIFVRHPITGALAAGVVVAPQHRHTGTLYHVEQALLMLAALVLLA